MRFKNFFIVIVMSCFLLCVGFSSAMAQNFNIDFGNDCGTPANTYGAAGQVGFWNNVSGFAPSALTDITLVPTPATVTVNAISYGNICDDCTSPENVLISDFFTGTSVPWSVIFNNLIDGDYTVFIYAPSPDGIPTGEMTVNGVSVPSLLGGNCNLVSGTSYVAVPVTVTGGTFTISGISSAPGEGLSGIQLQQQGAIPTMTEWGMIIFVVFAGLGAVYYLRRQKTAKS